MSLDRTPPPASIDFEPPAYSQPTLPPPADDLAAAPAWAKRWGARLLIGGIAALGAATTAAWALLPHGAPAAAAAAIVAPTKLTVSLDELGKAFPQQIAESACAEAVDKVPVVLYSSITSNGSAAGQPDVLEREMFSGAVIGESRSLTLTGRQVAVLRTTENDEPAPSTAGDHPGRYQGDLVVFDAATHQPLCQAHIDASPAKNMRWADVSPRGLHKTYVKSVREALLDKAGDLKVELAL